MSSYRELNAQAHDLKTFFEGQQRQQAVDLSVPFREIACANLCLELTEQLRSDKLLSN